LSAASDYRIHNWDDAIDAMSQNKMFILMESPAYPLLAAAINSTLVAGENLTVGSTVSCRLRA